MYTHLANMQLKLIKTYLKKVNFTDLCINNVFPFSPLYTNCIIYTLNLFVFL